MKIGIMTFWESNNNYGQILQLFALQKYLMKLGAEPYVIRFRRIAPKKKMTFFGKLIRFNPVSQYRQRKRAVYAKNFSQLDATRRFEEFKNDHIVFSEEVYFSLDDLKNNPPAADIYITGSDQVWNNSFRVSAEPFLLNFGDSTVRRIAYAASFGHKNLDSKSEQLFKRNINKFDAISVRERSGLDICKTLEVERAEWVLDPTFLFTQQNWIELLDLESLGESTLQKNIFIYVLGNSEISDKAAFINYAHSLKGFNILHASANNDRSGKLFPTIPEWVNLIRQSKFVITTSFHGVVFCIINNTNFVVLPNTGKAEGMNERIESLLSLLGLEDHMMSSFNKARLDTIVNKQIDWETINGSVDHYRKQSKDFLKKAVGVE